MMSARLATKFGGYLLTLWLIVSLNFCLIHLMPGDPLVHLLGEEGYAALGGQHAKAVAALKSEMGLNASPAVQYGRYLSRIITGQWGWSHHYGCPVADVIAQRLGRTLVLLVPAVVLSTLLGGITGAFYGWRSRHSRTPVAAALFLLLYACPAYCLGLVLLLAASCWPWMPLAGIPSHAQEIRPVVQSIQDLLLPLAVLVLHGTAYKFMLMRNAVRQELGEAYVWTALAKGLNHGRVLFGHVVINTLPAYLSAVALNIGFMVGGTLLVEVVFAWQGMGTLIYGAVLARDYPILSGVLTALAFSVVTANAAADMINLAFDPRIREGAPLA